MNKIEVKILNPEVFAEIKEMCALGARLTQRGHKIKNMNDLLNVYGKDSSEEFIKNLVMLPHPTLQKLNAINIAIVGASRRFLAQITRHQDGVKFISASLQYSDYSGEADFAIPYKMLGKQDVIDKYLQECKEAMNTYMEIAKQVGNDEAGYAAPQGLRNVLLMSVNPFELKHIIAQRICRRNTDETRIVMLKIWKKCFEYCPEIFYNAVPDCLKGGCKEGKMSCGEALITMDPNEILKLDFPLLEN